MSTKRPTRKQQRGQSSRNASSRADNESLEDVITALARAGYITMVASGDDITLGPVPDSLRVPDTVAPEEELAADTELFQQRRLPARIEKLLRRDAFGVWEHFKRIWLVLRHG